MSAILDERDAIAADAEAERQRGALQAEAARAWDRFLSERGSGDTQRPAPVRWRDEEGL